MHWAYQSNSSKVDRREDLHVHLRNTSAVYPAHMKHHLQAVEDSSGHASTQKGERPQETLQMTSSSSHIYSTCWKMLCLCLTNNPKNWATCMSTGPRPSFSPSALGYPLHHQHSSEHNLSLRPTTSHILAVPSPVITAVVTTSTACHATARWSRAAGFDRWGLHSSFNGRMADNKPTTVLTPFIVYSN